MDPALILGEHLTKQDKHPMFHHLEQHTVICLKGMTGSMPSPRVDTQPMEFQQEPLMINLINCLTENHDYDMSLSTFFVYIIIEVLGELDQLCFAANLASEAMLILEE